MQYEIPINLQLSFQAVFCFIADKKSRKSPVPAESEERHWIVAMRSTRTASDDPVQAYCKTSERTMYLKGVKHVL
jgi:protein tyrosine phosphatase (PTP) superfamily phosphohydrolase (DUF442 family)